MFDGKLRGTAAMDWLDTAQTYWQFSMQNYPAQQVTFVLSRLTGDARRWYDSTLGLTHGRQGEYCSAIDFINAFLDRYVLKDAVLHSRANWLKLSQASAVDIQTYNDNFLSALKLISLAPGVSEIDPSSAVEQYKATILPSIRERLMLHWDSSFVTDLPKTMACAVHCEDIIKQSKSVKSPLTPDKRYQRWDKRHKTGKRNNDPTSWENAPQTLANANAIPTPAAAPVTSSAPSVTRSPQGGRGGHKSQLAWG